MRCVQVLLTFNNPLRKRFSHLLWEKKRYWQDGDYRSRVFAWQPNTLFKILAEIFEVFALLHERHSVLLPLRHCNSETRSYLNDCKMLMSIWIQIQRNATDKFESDFVKFNLFQKLYKYIVYNLVLLCYIVF